MGPSAALEAMQAVAADARLVEYQPYWSARAALVGCPLPCSTDCRRSTRYDARALIST
jgi:predicted RNA polymerase sigma factor